MEAAAGLVVAEQVISTAVEGGAIAGYAAAQPTMPLIGHLTRFATPGSSPISDPFSLRGHCISVVNGKAYIFGGRNVEDGSLAGNEMHIVTLPHSTASPEPAYKCVPAIPAVEGGDVPSPAEGYIATPPGNSIAVLGRGDSGNEDVWAFDTESLTWSRLDVDGESSNFPQAREGVHSNAVVHSNSLILQLGNEVWSFDMPKRSWTNLFLPTTPASGTVTCHAVTVAQNKVYALTSTDGLGGEFWTLDLVAPAAEWERTEFPSNPLIPGPKLNRERTGTLLPVSTGKGREYLLYVVSMEEMWTYQLPSAKSTLASMKDYIREQAGADPGTGSWGKVELKMPENGISETRDYACAGVDASTILFCGKGGYLLHLK
ncbi:hypothetical protein H2199_001097 [Coniosporium tulheliwenetii]|uniref:Uncharacterized protein n=1 Tax=Coniosporium tulheliwenetii TaxID=3383036 RepID=A0ACC2ZL25_9PEZI|nr:hypothetical protein H2199_001097 [Cladosporium sp. JES 115]